MCNCLVCSFLAVSIFVHLYLVCREDWTHPLAIIPFCISLTEFCVCKYTARHQRAAYFLPPLLQYESGA